MKNKVNKKQNVSKLENLYTVMIMISAFLVSLVIQFVGTFKEITFETIIYNFDGITNFEATFNSLARPAVEVIISFVIIFGIFILPLKEFKKLKEKKFKFFNNLISLFPVNLKKWSIFVFVLSFISLILSLEVPGFIISNFNLTNLYDEYYVEYYDDMIEFPENKRNLITIYVESFENTVFSLKNGGMNKESYMPKLEKMTSKYINFSNNEKIGGFYEFDSTDFTAAALVAQTSGIPLFVKTKNDKGKYLEGAVSIGEILEENGYNNYFLIGSDGDFGNRKEYFTQHGNYDVADYFSAKDTGLIALNYYVWWGYEDRKLYSFAKDKLVKISKSNEPFNFSLLTVDTHFYDGYVDEGCPNKFDDNYANSFYCADTMLYDFLVWLEEQSFYENTTVVITGDHLTMRDDFFDTTKDYDRTVYTLFINSVAKTDNTKNRLFSAMDIYPTTLASIGATIKGNRLALGTNLFSDKETLIEELGYDYFKKEIRKKSEYYNKNIIKDKTK